jgi:hypothetical protein
MQRFTISKKRGERKLSYVGKVWSWSFLTSTELSVYSGVRGGGKCPEEEHTTCSGGPTILLSQARFMGREKIFIKYSIL